MTLSESPADESPLAPIASERTSFASRLRRVFGVVRLVDPYLIGILALAALLRLWDLNWDGGMHIHPDERFLTMFGTATHIPSSLAEYLNPSNAAFAPAQVGCSSGNCPYAFYVYGTLPVELNRVIAAVLGNDTYDGFTLQGRVLSAACDLVTLLFLFLTVRLLEQRLRLAPQIKYLAGALYAIAVLPIQMSHFYTVDMFLAVFMFISFYFSLRYALKGDPFNVGLSALFFALAVASKVNALAILPLNLYLVLSGLFPGANGNLWAVLRDLARQVRHVEILRTLLRAVGLMVLYGLASYFALRLADPYMFQSASFLDPHLSQSFLGPLQQANGYNNAQAAYPPGYQWVNKLPITFALTNIVLFGLGLPVFVAVVLGAYLIFTSASRSVLLVILLWVILFFLFQSVQYVKTMRYFIFLYPFLALFAAIGLHALLRGWPRAVQAVVALALLVWPLAFLSIYLHPHSRYTASQWMYAHLPANSYILSEAWDDPLPVGGVPNPQGKTFQGAILNVFDWDVQPGPNGALVPNPDKWPKMEAQLKRGDYLVLSSNRAWGSTPTVPDRFPDMVRYYQDLFAGKQLPGGARYKEVASFTSYPSLRYLGIPIDFPDQWAEEAFTVYDHPEVIIFQHVR